MPESDTGNEIHSEERHHNSRADDRPAPLSRHVVYVPLLPKADRNVYIGVQEELRGVRGMRNEKIVPKHCYNLLVTT